MSPRRLCCLLLPLFAMFAQAMPTLSGPTGLVTLPDALITPHQLEIAADVVDDFGDRGIAFRAVGRVGTGEVGVLYRMDDDPAWGVQGKVALPSAGSVQFGGGALYQSTDTVFDTLETTMLYLAATSELGRGLSGTLGATWTRIATSAGSADALRPYAGIHLRLSARMDIAAEYQAKSDALFEPDAISSLVIRRRRGEALTTTIGITNALTLLGRDEHFLFAGVTYQHR